MKINHFDDTYLRQLRTICTRLYDDKPLSGDDRRDLANKLDAILLSVETAEVDVAARIPLVRNPERTVLDGGDLKTSDDE